MPDGRITALLQARVLGYVFNPISIFWCHDSDGDLRQVIVEVHNTYGQRHAYLLPPASAPVLVDKKLYVSPFNPVSGHYQVRAPRPDHQVDVVVSLHGAGSAGLRRDAARHPPAGDHRPRGADADPGAVGPADGGVADPHPGHRAVAARDAGGAPQTGALAETPYPTIDPERWPAIAKVPTGPASAASAVVANQLLRRIAGRLPLRLAYPDGTVIGAGDAASPTLKIHQPDRLARRIGRHGLIGFGESYMAGEWESDTLDRGADHAGDRDGQPGSPRTAVAATRRDPLAATFIAAQPATGPANIAEHYDLSNDLFGEFLDETMTYSSALFAPACRPRGRTLPTPSAARSTACWMRREVGPGSRAAGNRHRVGRAVHPGGGTRRQRPLDHAVRAAATAGPAAGCGRRAHPIESRSSCVTTAMSAEITTR